MDAVEESKQDFPFEDLIPKKETNVLSFVESNPNYYASGNPIRIGILDTGVDPNAYGLQFLPDNTTRKLVDTIDCTGSGDVNVSYETQAKAIYNKEGGGRGELLYWAMTGLSGKTLKLNPKWNIQPFPNPNKDSAKKEETSTETKKEESTTETKEEKSEDTTVTVRYGIKRAYELFPSRLVQRVKQHRIREMQKGLEPHVANVKLELSKLDKKEIKQVNDLEARLEILQDKTWQDDDPGPLYDVVVFYDGQHYRAALDVKEDGDLTTAEAMTDYHKEFQWGTFGVADQFNYTVNFYSNGTVLSIVCDSSPHGTHVSGIASAYDPHNNKRHGVAPHAQIVSLKIGDSRLAAMETGTALARAMTEAVRTKCHVINLSFGEGCALPNRGRIMTLANELVWKHNICFVSSAGNNGPALSTVGAPGGVTSGILGVAAYVSTDMMKSNYSLMVENNSTTRQESSSRLVGTTFTWSSVGPTVDGDWGVNISAPGGAITAVPNWLLQKNMQMNGTSMSSPHTAGCVALLLAASQSRGISVKVPHLLRAISNTAKPMSNLSVLQQGWGMIQVDKAWEYLVTHKDAPHQDVHFNVCIENRSGQPRGVYLRQADELKERQTFLVHVDPVFGSNDNMDDKIQQSRIDFEGHYVLESTESSWVAVPNHFELLHNGRSFKIEVDPTQLDHGVHTAMVFAKNIENLDLGIMFMVPITIVKPMQEKNEINLGELEFAPAEVKRHFLSVPFGATWMDVTVQDCRDAAPDDSKDSSSRLVVLHTIQLLPHKAYRDAEVEKYFSLLPGQTTVTSVPVHSGITIEVDIARYWSAVGSTKVKVCIQFRGVWPIPQEMQMLSGGGGTMVRIESHIQNETVQPIAKLSEWKTPLRPKSEGEITPLGQDRDFQLTTDKRIYQLVLSYEFEQGEAGSIIPRVPALQGVLYESAYESQLILVFDSDKRYLGCADSWPKEIKVPKGAITIRLQIRHGKVEQLQKLKDLAIWIERKLEKEIALSVYTSKEDMMTGNGTMKRRILRKGCIASVFLAEPSSSMLPSSCKSGDVLFGTVTFANSNDSLPGDGKRPGGFFISLLVGPKAEAKKKENETAEPPDERTVIEKMNDAARDAKVSQLDKLTEKEKEKEDGKFEELYGVLEKEYPEHIPLLVAALKHYDSFKPRSKVDLDKVIESSDKVSSRISEDELALHFGKNHDKDDPKSCKEHKDMEEKKGHMVDALARKARAISEKKGSDAEATKEFEDALKLLKSWENIDSNQKFASLVLDREARAGRHGSALKLINELLKTNGDSTKGGICPMSKSDLYLKRSQLLEELGYEVLVQQDKKWRCISEPKDYALF